MYNQKEIVLVPFPYSDLSGIKQRPALIISGSKINKTQDRICCLITSKENKEDLAITESDFEQGKLPFKSFVKTHRIFTIHEGIIRKKLCKVTNSFYKKIIVRINEHLSIT